DLVPDREHGRDHGLSVFSPRRAYIPRPVRWQRSRCESGAVPQLRCPFSKRDEPGRLHLADELSPRRKGGSRGAAAGPPPSARCGGVAMKIGRFAGAAALAVLVLAAPAGARHGTVPQRIVSLSPTATEDLFAIGAGKQVVAVDNQSNYPAGAPK